MKKAADGGLFTLGYHQPNCEPATATTATTSMIRVVFLIYAPGAA
ncbi:hypothetical protein [Enterobacter sp. RIT418]|nr:hypothetical protein [Enterobacter sp. RIT 418]